MSLNNVTNARQSMFKDLKPSVTRIVNALTVSAATALAVADTKPSTKK